MEPAGDYLSGGLEDFLQSSPVFGCGHYDQCAAWCSHAIRGRIVEPVLPGADGKAVFYTGDTGAGLSNCWEHISPQLMIIEVTAPSSERDFATESEHLTTDMLAEELRKFQELNNYLPDIVVVHMNPQVEVEMAVEIKELASQLNASITLDREGMQIHV